MTDILIAIDISEHNTKKNSHFIKLFYLKRKGLDRDREIEQPNTVH